VVGEPGRGVGPDPRRVRGVDELVGELDLLRVRAAADTLRAKVSIEALARLVRLPRSTVHRYVTGRSLVPSQVLDRIVIALGASPAEQREWNDAWYRVHGRASAAGPDVLNGLPAPVRGFAGRAAQLAELDGVAGRGAGTVIAAVSGAPGVGKTALVARWAHRARDRFPDGCLFVDLRGYDPDRPVEPAAALGTLLGCLAPGEEIAAAPAVLTARYRSLLAGRRTLVVLDNALCAEQVRPLLPGADAGMVVVTSRDDLAGLAALHGAHRIGLDVLPLPDALTLLENLLGPGRGRAGMAQRCGRLPLALRVAALTDHAGEGLDWLETGDPRTDVRTVFSWSYRVLLEREPEAAELLRALGRHRGQDFQLATAAALGHTTSDRARRLLGALLRANLVQEPLPGRYRLPHLLRAYAAELAANTEPRTA
jgi:hypothetical protein